MMISRIFSRVFSRVVRRTIGRAGVAAGLAVLGACITPAYGDDPAPESLAGPSVKPQDSSPSIVERDFSGRLKRIEADPVLTAIDRLELDSATREKVAAVVAERNAILDRLVENNLRTLVELNGARQSNDQAKTREYVAKLMSEARPLLDRGTLADEVGPLLPEDKRAELSRMLSEYRSAALDDRMSGNESGKPLGRFEASTTEFLTNFGQEIKRAYERTFVARKADFDKLLTTLNLSPEQEAKVQSIVLDAVQKNEGKLSPRDRRTTFMKIYRMLDADQRSLLMERLREQRELGNQSERRRGAPRPSPMDPMREMPDKPDDRS